MKLKDVFRSNTDVLDEAFAQNDLKTIRSFRAKKDTMFKYSLDKIDFANYPREMAEMLVNEFTDKDWKNWGFGYSDDRAAVLRSLMFKSMAAGREDLFDLYFNAASYNSDNGYNHPLYAILKSKISEDMKTRMTKEFVLSGLDKVRGKNDFIDYAIAGGARGAFDALLPALQAELHKNNESILRSAAGYGQKDMVRHLVRKYGADINLAITTARTAGQDSVWRTLEDVRREIYPDEDAPPTIESLSDELNALKIEMRAMREEMTALRRATGTAAAPAAPGLN